MLHHDILETYRYAFTALNDAIVKIPAEDSPFLQWIRNQFLVGSYITLLLTSNWVFIMAQLIYNDGAIFVTFWKQMMTI